MLKGRWNDLQRDIHYRSDRQEEQVGKCHVYYDNEREKNDNEREDNEREKNNDERDDKGERWRDEGEREREKEGLSE